MAATAVFAVLALTALLEAQQQRIRVLPGGGVVYYREGTQAVDLPSNRNHLRGIERARDRIAAGEYTPAIRYLDEILSHDEDSFLEIDAGKKYTGLKETANSLLRDLPPEGRELYRSMFGELAQRKLVESLKQGDMKTLRMVARRYFYTPAGCQAALLLAEQECDSGRHLSATLMYQHLLDTPEAVKQLEPQLSLLAAKSWLALGDTNRAAKLIASASERNNQRHADSVPVAGNSQSLNDVRRDPLDWFRKTVGLPQRADQAPETDWLMPGGNPTHNGRSSGGLPHTRVRWQARLLNHPQYEALYQDLWTTLKQREQPLPPAGVPLAVGDVVISTTPHNLIAVNLRTGKRIWQTQPQRVAEFEQLLTTSGNEPQQGEAQFAPLQSFSRRIWQDGLYNSVSSDGQRVFVIRDLAPPETQSYEAFTFPMGQSDETVGPSNRLCAYDLSTQGKLVWELDGAANAGDLQGAFFLGAPVAVDDYLYCLAELKSSIHLVTIHGATGKVVGMQELAALQAGIGLDLPRRMQAAMPSYDAGILVCPTCAGAVIGIDLESNAFLWAYRYELDHSLLGIINQKYGEPVAMSSWIESSTVIADGRVLMTSPDCDSLHCLDLVTGELCWRRNREDGIFVAGVDEGRVLIVGMHDLVAVRLENNQLVWGQQAVPLPDGATPSGKGFFSDGKYYLPLSTGAVVEVDLASGDIVETTRVGSGDTLGNLIAHQGTILSQNGQHLDCFDQLAVLRERTSSQLAKNPDDYEALRTLGEIAYGEGDLQRAIQLLTRAQVQSANDPRTCEVLSDCLLEGLEQDFTTYRDAVPLLDNLLKLRPEKLATLFRVESDGLLKSGDPLGALEKCFDLFEASEDVYQVVPLAENHDASMAAWLQAQVAALWYQADAKQRQQMVDLLSHRQQKLTETADPETVRRFTTCFAVPGETLDQESLEIAQAFVKNGAALAAQQIFLDLSTLATGTVQRASVALNWQLLHERQEGVLAQPFDAILAGPLADQPCLGGKTGKQLLTEAGVADRPGSIDWPHGRVEVTQDSPQGRIPNTRTAVPLIECQLEHSDAVLGRCNVFFPFQGGDVVVRDPLGREFFRQVLGDEERQIYNPQGIYGVSRGSLLILSLGQKILAFDTLAPDGTNRLLWSRNTVRTPVERFPVYRQVAGNPVFRPGSYRPGRTQSQFENRWLGVLGPISSSGLVSQDQRGLTCVDPLTGHVKWVRTDGPNACHLFGNDQLIIAMENSGTSAQVFNMLDGRSMGQVSVPELNMLLTTVGTNAVTWQSQPNGGYRLSSVDVMNGNEQWSHSFAGGAQVDVASGNLVAVVEPSGRYWVGDAKDGKVLVDHESHLTINVKQVHLIAGTDTLTIAVEDIRPPSRPPGLTWLNVFPDSLQFNGDLLCFDRSTGASLWPRPARVQNQVLLLSQPVDLPVIVFAGNYRSETRNDRQQKTSLMLLEKASGRVLFADENLPQSSNHLDLSVDPAEHTLSVNLVNRTIRLAFTEAPRPPEPPLTFEAKVNSETGPRGLYRIFQKLGIGD